MKCAEFEEATNYISDVFRKPATDYNSLPVWIRPSTGELCLDLVQGGTATSFGLPWWQLHILRLENVSLDAPDSEGAIISSLSQDQYYELCSGLPIARLLRFQISTQYAVGQGILRSDSQRGTCVRITGPLVLPEKELYWDDYNGRAAGELLPNSWIRYDSRRIRTLDRQCGLELELQLLLPSHEIQKAWLAQATSIFTELQEETHVEDYVCVVQVWFILRVANIDPEGYLFVCPPRDFRTGTEPHANLYQWPACPAYWSLDPSGADRLSTEDAKSLGFPAIHIETLVFGKSWDRSVIKGCGNFTKAKGSIQIAHPFRLVTLTTGHIHGGVSSTIAQFVDR
ncbi:hypothetical protein MSAN_01517400 [Mycena sanguinolenta]|uniref:Uncharacterized protein n=1 Tax=Mycena sanguinolenta TaxID=230812 RepID=A0A8H6Y6F9_9AGAR|nr:hypothetical protein MSAN_01517400 [Mycena sanguinolenta]